MNHERKEIVYLAVLVIMLMLAVLFTGCATTPLERARVLGCREACARYQTETGRPVMSSWPAEPGECACRFDDNDVALTCERPSEGTYP